MPSVQERVLGIFGGDIHLSDNPPIARIDEDWYEAMARPLREIKALKKKHDCPAFCTGDIMHTWNKTSSKLINFAIEEFPFDYAVPGNHDLPYHNIEEIDKSPYHTLELAGVIKTIKEPLEFDKFIVYGVAWGQEPVRPIHNPLLLNVALIHAYIWKPGYGFPGAPERALLDRWCNALRDYHFAAFGDNHKGFMHVENDLTILNCGGFYRRSIDQRDYRPHVGLLYESGAVELHYLDCSQDKMTEDTHLVEIESYAELDQFMDYIDQEEDNIYDFEEAVEAYVLQKELEQPVKDQIRRMLNE